MGKKDNKKAIKDTEKTAKTNKTSKKPTNVAKEVSKITKESTENIKNSTEIKNELDKVDDNVEVKITSEDSEMQTAREKELLSALKEIGKGEGVYSTDKLKHAENTIENMKKIAIDALDKYEKSLE